MFEILRSAAKYYAEEKHRENMKKRLLKSHLDYEYLEYMINEVDSKRVEMNIELNDHTKVNIRPIAKSRKDPLFTGD